MFTILGADGFIGSHLAEFFKANEIDFQTLDPRDKNYPPTSLGNVIYSIGLTSDFRERPIDTVNSHVCSLLDLLKNSQWESLTYLSSTRIYAESSSTKESSSIIVNPINSNDLYNISKILGESILLTLNKPKTKIIRLSNVVGNNFSSDDFIFSIIKDAVNTKKVSLKTSLESEKDYVNIDDVVRIIPEIILKGKNRIYNVASGKNLKNEEILEQISELTNCEIEVIPNAPKNIFPKISIDRLIDEFDFKPTSVISNLDSYVQEFQKKPTQ